MQTLFVFFLLPSSKHSLWDALKKLKLNISSNCMEKTKVRLGDKVIKLREERELLGRFLIIQGSRPELVPRLEETIGEYEMAVVPRSLCPVDGSLYAPNDKASMMRLIEEANPQPTLETPTATGSLHRILLLMQGKSANAFNARDSSGVTRTGSLTMHEKFQYTVRGFAECETIVKL